MSSNHLCPVARSPITAGDPVLALAWPRWGRDVYKTKKGNFRRKRVPNTETLESLLMFVGITQSARQNGTELGRQSLYDDARLFTGSYDDAGWIEDDQGNPVLLPNDYGDQDGLPVTNGPFSVVLMHRWAAETLVGSAFVDDGLWIMDLIVQLRFAGVQFGSDFLGDTVMARELQARTRLQGILARGLEEMTAEHLRKDDRDGRYFPCESDLTAADLPFKAVISGFWTGLGDPAASPEPWKPDSTRRSEWQFVPRNTPRTEGTRAQVVLRSTSHEALLERVTDWLRTYGDWHTPEQDEGRSDWDEQDLPALQERLRLNVEFFPAA